MLEKNKPDFIKGEDLSKLQIREIPVSSLSDQQRMEIEDDMF